MDAIAEFEKGITEFEGRLNALGSELNVTRSGTVAKAVAKYFRLTDRSGRSPSHQALAEARAIYRKHSKEIDAAISVRTGMKVSGSNDESTAKPSLPTPTLVTRSVRVLSKADAQEKYDAWQALLASAQGKPDSTVNKIKASARRYFSQNAEAIKRVIAISRAH